MSTKALLNLCTLNYQQADEPQVLCTGTPGLLKKRATAKAGKGEHHRKLLLQPSKASDFIIEPVT